MVWICTEAVESTVHEHLNDQLWFLETRDDELHQLIFSIREEELAHLTEAKNRQDSRDWLHDAGIFVIGSLTGAMIWLSTWGDSSWIETGA